MRQMNWSIDDKTLQLDESFPDGDRIMVSLQKVYEKWSDKSKQWVECDGDCWVLVVKVGNHKTGETVNHSPSHDTGTLPEMFQMACELARELMARKCTSETAAR